MKSLSPTFMQKTFLLQDENLSSLSKNDLRVVTKIKPTENEINNLLFANQVCKHVKSNAIVISNNKKTLVSVEVKQAVLGLQKLLVKTQRSFFLMKL